MKSVKKIITYLFSSGLSKGVPILILPIVTKFLSPEDFGIWSIYQILSSFVFPIVGFSLAIHVNKNFHHLSKEALKSLIGDVIIISFIICITLVILTLPFYYLCDSAKGLDLPLLLALPFIGFFNFIILLNLSVLKNLEKPFQYSAIELSKAFIHVLISITLIALVTIGWKGLAYGIAISAFSVGMASLFNLYKMDLIRLTLEYADKKKLFILSIPLLPHAIGGIVISLGDRFIIEYYLGLTSVGIYSIASTLSMILLLASETFIKIWSPWFYKQFKDITEIKKKVIVNYTYYYFVGILLLAILNYTVAHFFITLFLPLSYQDAKSIIFIICMGIAFNSMYNIFFPYMVCLNKTKFIGLITIFFAILNIVLNILLIPIMGLNGAALATLIAYVGKFLTSFVYLNKTYNMPWFYLNRQL